MKTLLLGLFTCVCLQPVTAQAQDIGLTMDAGLLTVLYGQDCGPVSCTPFPSGPVGVGQTRILMHYSAPSSLYAVAIGAAGPCVVVPGFDNVLLLQSPFVLAFGLTSTPPFVPLPCQQGLASVSLSIPAGTPSGLLFRVQSFGQSLSGPFAFGPAIEAVTL